MSWPLHTLGGFHAFGVKEFAFFQWGYLRSWCSCHCEITYRVVMTQRAWVLACAVASLASAGVGNTDSGDRQSVVLVNVRCMRGFSSASTL